MTKLFCHNCDVKLGVSLPANTNSPLDSEYQLEKFLKHTAPVKYSYVSVFDSTGTENYKNYTVSTASSGWVEEDDRGRINMVWYAGKYTGATFENGIFKSLMAFSAQIACTSPPFISRIPGPYARSPSILNSNSPASHTVSKWERIKIVSSPSPYSNFR